MSAPNRFTAMAAPSSRLWIISLLAWLLLACVADVGPDAAPPVEGRETPALPQALAGRAEQAIPALILLERQASIEGDLTTLAAIWHEDAEIIDGRNTLATEDDYRWAGRPAILDRYRLAVFPHPPPPLDELPELTLAVQGRTATAVNGVDRWRFVRADDGWRLAELVYLRP